MAKDYLASAGAQAAALVTAAASTIFITRLLGPQGRGEYALLAGAIQLSCVIGQFGFQAGAIYFGSKRLILPETLTRAARNLAVLSGLPLMLVVGTIFALYPSISGMAGPVSLAIALGTVPILLLGQLRAAVLLALQRIVSFNRIFVTQQLLWLCGLLVLVPFWRSSAAALSAYAFSLIVWERLIDRALRADTPTGPSRESSLQALGQILAFGLRFWPGAVLQLLNQRISLFIVSAHLDTASVGLYSVATVTAESLWQLATSVGQVNLSRVAAKGSEGVLLDRVGQSCRIAVAMTLAASVVIGALAPILIAWLFGARFLPAATPLRILLPGTAFFSIYLLLANDLVARGYPDRSSITSAISVVISIVLYTVLVPRAGLDGAALAGSLSYLLAACIMAVVHHRATGLPTHRFVLARPSDFVTGAAIIRSTIAGLLRPAFVEERARESGRAGTGDPR